MKSTQSLSAPDNRLSTGDHFFDKFFEKLKEERNERRRTYINVVLVVACVSLIILKFVA